jgi:hypothetical protein
VVTKVRNKEPFHAQIQGLLAKNIFKKFQNYLSFMFSNKTYDLTLSPVQNNIKVTGPYLYIKGMEIRVSHFR